MKIIVACEYSGRIRQSFSDRGHDAWSADLLPSDLPGNHIVCDNDMHLKDILYTKHWDVIIAHPPCTRLCNSGWWYVKKHNLQHETIAASVFFNMILNAPVEKICIENPVMNCLARQLIRKWDQGMQPFNFGEDACKDTRLWLKGLMPLNGTRYVKPRIVYKNGKYFQRWSNQTDGGWNKLPPYENRGHDRSLTYWGIAKAMAEQWG